MTTTDAVVVRLDGDYAWVRAEGAGNACGACERKEGCHGSGTSTLLDGVLAQPVRLLRLPNPIHARPGDAVVVSVAAGVVLHAVWLAYGIPLLLAIAAALVASALTGSELQSIVGALLGLGGGYLVMRRQGLNSAGAEPILSISFKATPISFHEG
jgi:sigma-E factor negative regulatory protein RseC